MRACACICVRVRMCACICVHMRRRVLCALGVIQFLFITFVARVYYACVCVACAREKPGCEISRIDFKGSYRLTSGLKRAGLGVCRAVS